MTQPRRWPAVFDILCEYGVPADPHHSDADPFRRPLAAGLWVERARYLSELGRTEEARKAAETALHAERVGETASPSSIAVELRREAADLAAQLSSRAMAIDPGVDIGHVHLKVADIDRSLAFYQGVLGFDVMQRMGDQAAFISAGGYHHHIGLNTWESRGGSQPAPGTTGLYHVAIRYPTRKSLAGGLKAVLDAGIPLTGATDHGVSEALYLRDPDGNGIELYRDRPEAEWPRKPDGSGVAMVSERLDLDALLAELDG